MLSRKPFFFLAIMLVAVLSACGGDGSQTAAVGPAQGAYRGSEPPRGIPMPEFVLRDVLSGERINSDGLRGNAVLVTFLDTDCTDKCPLIASAVGDALRLLPGSVRERTRALVISVNPVIDTPKSVRRFLRERQAQAITYLSGSVADLKPIWKRFGVVSAYETGNADTHSADVRVFNPEGVWVSTQHSGVDLTPANLVHDVELALRS
jgi:cytochrome oxidase Cu insertion factor (SCO1/SenC/PrrC family)